jgi:hypothetical protein
MKDTFKDQLLVFFQKLDERLSKSYPVSYKRQFNIVISDIPLRLNSLPDQHFAYESKSEGGLVSYNLKFVASEDFISVYVGDNRSSVISYSGLVLRTLVEYERLEHDLFHSIRKIESLKTAGFIT